jgi:hypothetical protein
MLEGSTTLPSVPHLHLLTRLYSVITLHSLMKWLVLLQKLQVVLVAPAGCSPVFLGLLLLCCISMAVLSISLRLATAAMSASILMVVGSKLGCAAGGTYGFHGGGGTKYVCGVLYVGRGGAQYGDGWYWPTGWLCTAVMKAPPTGLPMIKFVVLYTLLMVYGSSGKWVSKCNSSCCITHCASLGWNLHMKFCNWLMLESRFLLMR